MNPASGGPAQGIRNNIPFWKMQGVLPTVLSFDDKNSSFLVKGENIAIGPSKTAWAYVPQCIDWLLENLCDYDVVIIHGLWLYNGYAVTKAIKQLKKGSLKIPKVYIMPHGMLDPYFQKAPERRLKAIRNILYWHLIEKHVINNADGVLFTCEEEMLLAKTTFKGYLPKMTYNIGYGIETPPLYSKQLAAGFFLRCPKVANKTYFLFLSRLHQKKGVDILLNAYIKCYNYFRSKDMEIPDLVIAGPGIDSKYGNTLKAIISKSPEVEEKIHFPQMLVGDAKWGALYSSELFILPSHQENFGIAIVESMACKTAVMISNKVNIWREIYDGGGGIIVNDTLESVVEGLKNWIGLTPEEKKKHSENAYITYKKHFTAQEASSNFLTILSTQ